MTRRLGLLHPLLLAAAATGLAACGGPDPEEPTVRSTASLDARVPFYQRELVPHGSTGVVEVVDAMHDDDGLHIVRTPITRDGPGETTSTRVPDVDGHLVNLIGWHRHGDRGDRGRLPDR